VGEHPQGSVSAGWLSAAPAGSNPIAGVTAVAQKKNTYDATECCASKNTIVETCEKMLTPQAYRECGTIAKK